MGNKDRIAIDFKGLNCANCARKIEEKVGKMEGVKESNLNFHNYNIEINVKLERKVKERACNITHEIKKDS